MEGEGSLQRFLWEGNSGRLRCREGGALQGLERTGRVKVFSRGAEGSGADGRRGRRGASQGRRVFRGVEGWPRG